MAEEARCQCRFIDAVTWTVPSMCFKCVACENDAEAIVMARRMSANTGAVGFELWQDERWVHMETIPSANRAGS